MLANQMLTGLRILVPTVGGRTLKTCVAILLAIMTARLCHLAAPQFAGIVAVLAVQPSVHRSLRQGARQIVSAFTGAVTGVLFLYVFGLSPWVFALAALIVMGLHVRWGWTNSLLVAVVISLNTIGSQGMSYLHGGLNQLCLVLIGIGYGNFVNILFKPAHGPRYDKLLTASEREVFKLLRTVHKDLQRGTATPYVVFRRNIDRVRSSLDEGKRIGLLVLEDRKYRNASDKHLLHAFHTLESMVERIRDVNKSLQGLKDSHERSELTRLVEILIRVQRRMVWGHACHFPFVDAAYRQVQAHFYDRALPTDHASFIGQATEYHVYMHLTEYYGKLKDLRTASQNQFDIASHA